MGTAGFDFSILIYIRVYQMFSVSGTLGRHGVLYRTQRKLGFHASTVSITRSRMV